MQITLEKCKHKNMNLRSEANEGCVQNLLLKLLVLKLHIHIECNIPYVHHSI